MNWRTRLASLAASADVLQTREIVRIISSPTIHTVRTCNPLVSNLLRRLLSAEVDPRFDPMFAPCTDELVNCHKRYAECREWECVDIHALVSETKKKDYFFFEGGYGYRKNIFGAHERAAEHALCCQRGTYYEEGEYRCTGVYEQEEEPYTIGAEQHEREVERRALEAERREAEEAMREEAAMALFLARGRPRRRSRPRREGD